MLVNPSYNNHDRAFSVFLTPSLSRSLGGDPPRTRLIARETADFPGLS